MVSKAEQSAKTREALLAAATALFAERGYQATSIKAIAERAGISHGVIPFHFGAKEGLLSAVVERAFETFRASVFGALVGRERDFGLGDLAAFVRAQEAFQDAHPETGRLFQVLMFEAIGPSPELRAPFRELHARLHRLGCEWMAAGQAAGSIDPALDVSGTVDALLSFFAGVRTHQLLLEPGQIDRKNVHAQMLRVLARGATPRERSED